MGDPLSQEEIDKLLSQAQGGGDEESASAQGEPPSAEATAEGDAKAEGAAEDADGDEPVGEASAQVTAEASTGQTAEAGSEPAPKLEVADFSGKSDSSPLERGEGTFTPSGFTTIPPRSEPSILGAVESTTTPAAAQKVQFGALPGQGDSGVQSRAIDLLLDVRLQITAELGRKILSIKDILSLGPGTVVELEKVAGEPVDLFVNEKLIARGEVVVIDENFGVRVTEVVSPTERISRLG